MTNDDWLDTSIAEPGATLPAIVAVPVDFASRVALVETCWARLTLPQRTFLTAWRECRYNASAAARHIGLSSKTKPHTLWMHQPDYAMVVQAWRASAATDILHRDHSLVRQEDIIETLLTPKPVLYQGIPVMLPDGSMLTEVEAGAAARANEAILDRVMPKPRADVEINVGVAFTPPLVEVEKSKSDAIDVTPEIVEASPPVLE